MAGGPERFFVITGGSGSGKTTLIEALACAGHATAAEAGRGIIRDQMAIDGSALPWRDRQRFAETMLCWDMRSYRIAETRVGPVFFDRGIPDVIGYLRLVGLPVPAHLEKAARTFRYSRRVFIAPPWPEIFTRDNERRQAPEEAIRTYEAMLAVYADFGYQPVELPRIPMEDRLRFVIGMAG